MSENIQTSFREVFLMGNTIDTNYLTLLQKWYFFNFPKSIIHFRYIFKGFNGLFLNTTEVGTLISLIARARMTILVSLPSKNKAPTTYCTVWTIHSMIFVISRNVVARRIKDGLVIATWLDHLEVLYFQNIKIRILSVQFLHPILLICILP